MDQPVTEDEHKEKVQDGDRKERKEERGGRCERKKQTKQRQEDRACTVCLPACIGVEMTDGSLYDICLCVYMCAERGA